MSILKGIKEWIAIDPSHNILLLIATVPGIIYGLGFIVVPLFGMLGFFPSHAYTGMYP